ncbi:AI-2E family transporter [Proteocatella sphenisci]|uniref:AI-2E family transporter n=1 Tax=Proteocatella sphenisci TaxID=181070 RepID=UPI00048DFA5A|nr:AI-2E family transporter [Proteocatella sphenisci]
MARLVIKKDILERSLSNLLAFSGAIIVYFVILNLSGIFKGIGNFTRMMSPFVYGFVIAYLLKNPMKYIEKFYYRLIKKEKYKKLIRGLSISTTLLFSVVVLTGFVSIIIPQLSDSISIFISNLPLYMENVDNFTKGIVNKIDFNSSLVEQFLSAFQTLISKTSEIVSKLLPAAVNILLSVSGKLVDIIIGIVVSIYFLAGKEKFAAQIKKTIFALIPQKSADYILEKAQMTNRIFSKYISGQLTDAAVLGIICFISMSVLRMPYALLVSMIVTVTNIIPVIGPFIGAVPSIFIISMVSFPKAIGFAILVLVLQQLDANILVPKIIGDSTGLSGFWVFLAIFAGGGIFGITGVILGVPTMAVTYNIVKEIIENRLCAKGKPKDTSQYM